VTWTWMSRIDPEKNANRWYAVGVQPTLFDPVALITAWGSRETAFQEVEIEPFEDQDAARAAADQVIREKVRQKGAYRIMGGYRPPGIEELEASREPVAGDGEG